MINVHVGYSQPINVSTYPNCRGRHRHAAVWWSQHKTTICARQEITRNTFTHDDIYSM